MPSLRHKILVVGRFVAALVICLTAAELTARIDDNVFQDVPLSASPDRERDLVLHQVGCTRGRPNGRYQRWRLNAFGFRGPEITEQPRADVRRAIILGASESFGLYETEDHEYAAQLRVRLAGSGRRDIEIVNASMAGMKLPRMLEFWECWARNFGAELVLVYPSTQFYLDIRAPRAAPLPADDPSARRPWRSRFADRVAGLLRDVPVLKASRRRIVLQRELAGKPSDYVFDELAPKDRLEAFTRDLDRLGSAIATDGATPVLVSHAFKFSLPINAQDRSELEYFRLEFPRATPGTFIAFEKACREATIRLGRQRGWPVIDAAAILDGHRDWFADPVHFNDEGSARLAAMLEAELPGLLASQSQGP